MILKNTRLYIALLCLALANIVVAQNEVQNDPAELRLYYSDLYLALSPYEIDDVPFREKNIKLRRNDSLLKLAQRNRIKNLDPLHFAAALYEANAPIIGDGDLSLLAAGSTIKMPSVGDIFYAQNRYEKLTLTGGTLDFANNENQMRIGLRQPFGESQSMIGPLAGNDFLRSEDFTLPSQRRHTGNSTTNGFQSQRSREPVLAAARAANTKKKVVVAQENTAKDRVGAEPTAKRKSDSEKNQQAPRLVTAESDGSYLGPPRQASEKLPVNSSSDPMGSAIEWEYQADATVGAVFKMLVEYVGYELTSTDASVLHAYARQLPALQRSINGITAEQGFLMLAGRGLETEFDHVSRSVKHTPRRKAPARVAASDIKASKTLEQFVQASGITSMLRQFPADITTAANRHASRCDSSVSSQKIDPARLNKRVVARLQQKTLEPAARKLVDWYESPTGRKVLELEQRQIDEEKFERFSKDNVYGEHIKQIYHNTLTGKGIASVAVELDYAGWLLSGCRQQAERSGDAQKMSLEIAHGQGIKKKKSKLESLLREDMHQTLAYQFSTLDDGELAEYAEVLTEHAFLYAELEQAIVDALEQEAIVNGVSR